MGGGEWCGLYRHSLRPYLLCLTSCAPLSPLFDIGVRPYLLCLTSVCAPLSPLFTAGDFVYFMFERGAEE